MPQHKLRGQGTAGVDAPLIDAGRIGLGPDLLANQRGHSIASVAPVHTRNSVRATDARSRRMSVFLQAERKYDVNASCQHCVPADDPHKRKGAGAGLNQQEHTEGDGQ